MTKTHEPIASALGVYPTTHALDHDVEALIQGVLTELDARRVEWATAVAAVRRAARSLP